MSGRKYVMLAYVDQGYAGETLASAAVTQGMHLKAITYVEAKRSFVLLPRCWVVERDVTGTMNTFT